MKKDRFYKILIFFALLYLLSRVALLFFPADEILSVWEWDDALYPGVIANELICGLKMPFFDHIQLPHTSDTLICGLLVAPFFWLFGESLFMVNLVSILFSLGTLILWYLFFGYWVNKRAGILMGLFLLFAPPVFLGHSLVLTGGQNETMFFDTLIIFLFFKSFFVKKQVDPVRTGPCLQARRSFTPAWVMLCGIVTGIALWFDYSVLISVVTCLIFSLVVGIKKETARYLLVYFLFCILGLIPWFWYNISRFWSAAHIYDVSAYRWFHFDIGYFLHKIKGIFTGDLQASLYFMDYSIIKKEILSFSYALILLLGFMILLFTVIRRFLSRSFANLISRPLWKNLDTFFLIYIFVFALSYGFSRFDIFTKDESFFAYRYLLLLQILLLAVLALAIDHLWRSRRIKAAVPVFMAGTILICSLFGFLSLFSAKNAYAIFCLDAYDYSYLGDALYNNNGKSMERVKAKISDFDERRHRAIMAGALNVALNDRTEEAEELWHESLLLNEEIGRYLKDPQIISGPAKKGGCTEFLFADRSGKHWDFRSYALNGSYAEAGRAEAVMAAYGLAELLGVETPVTVKYTLTAGGKKRQGIACIVMPTYVSLKEYKKPLPDELAAQHRRHLFFDFLIFGENHKDGDYIVDTENNRILAAEKYQAFVSHRIKERISGDTQVAVVFEDGAVIREANLTEERYPFFDRMKLPHYHHVGGMVSYLDGIADNAFTGYMQNFYIYPQGMDLLISLMQQDIDSFNRQFLSLVDSRGPAYTRYDFAREGLEYIDSVVKKLKERIEFKKAILEDLRG
ncbi:MAG: hypothetical protein HQ558_00425 [Candidatus Omnitrophica bacterium]|nr:hypothetical protein [Candidatus Omnitrophota bacterium]